MHAPPHLVSKKHDNIAEISIFFLLILLSTVLFSQWHSLECIFCKGSISVVHHFTTFNLNRSSRLDQINFYIPNRFVLLLSRILLTISNLIFAKVTVGFCKFEDRVESPNVRVEESVEIYPIDHLGTHRYYRFHALCLAMN